jgi:hypothetical protein
MAAVGRLQFYIQPLIESEHESGAMLLWLIFPGVSLFTFVRTPWSMIFEVNYR